MELEKDGNLPFLDTLLRRREHRGQHRNLLEDHTHRSVPIQYTSHHPAHVKRGVASCLFHRARTVAIGKTSGERRNIWQKSWKQMDTLIRSAARPRREREPEETPRYTICIPYVSGVGENLRRVCRRYDIRTIFTTISTLRRQLA